MNAFTHIDPISRRDEPAGVDPVMAVKMMLRRCKKFWPASVRIAAEAIHGRQSHANPCPFASVETLAEDQGCSVRTMRRGLSAGQALGVFRAVPVPMAFWRRPYPPPPSLRAWEFDLAHEPPERRKGKPRGRPFGAGHPANLAGGEAANLAGQRGADDKSHPANLAGGRRPILHGGGGQFCTPESNSEEQGEEQPSSLRSEGGARARATPHGEEAGESIEASAHEPEAWEVGNIFGTLGDDPMPEEAAPAPEPAPEPEVAVAPPPPQPEPVAAAEIAQEPAAPSRPKSSTTAKRARKAKRRAADLLAAEVPLPSWLPPDAWEAWCEHRRAKRRGSWTPPVARACLKRLADLREEGHEPAAVIANSVAAGWTGLFPPKPERAVALRPGGGVGPAAVAFSAKDEQAFRSYWRAYPLDKDEQGARAAFANALRDTDAGTILRTEAWWWVTDGCTVSAAKHHWHAKNWLARRLWDHPPPDAVADLPDAVLHKVIRAMWERGEDGEADPAGVGRALRAAVGLPAV